MMTREAGRGVHTHFAASGVAKLSHNERDAKRFARATGRDAYGCPTCGKWHVGTRPRWMGRH